jgi:TatD DNase family protein
VDRARKAAPHRSGSAPAREPAEPTYHAPVRLIDSHCHVNAHRFADDAELVIGAALLVGVERILVPGWNVASCERALELVERISWLDAAVGVHPHDAEKVDDAGWDRIRSWAYHPRVVAIGETGLDYDRVFSPIPDQLTNLRRNLHLALEIGKPVILHCRSTNGARDAQDALLSEVRALGPTPPPLVIHSFSGPVDYARAMLDLGAAISFSGLVFRAGEEASAEVARLVPQDRLLVETDSPFLTPPGAPRKRNEPAFVEFTAAWVADQRAVEQDAFGDTLVAAYDRTFPRAANRS